MLFCFCFTLIIFIKFLILAYCLLFGTSARFSFSDLSLFLFCQMADREPVLGSEPVVEEFLDEEEDPEEVELYEEESEQAHGEDLPQQPAPQQVPAQAQAHDQDDVYEDHGSNSEDEASDPDQEEQAAEPSNRPQVMLHDTSGSGHLASLLRRVTAELNYPMPPHYYAKRHSRPGKSDMWYVAVHFKVYDPIHRSDKAFEIHEAMAPRSSLAAGVSDAARQALFAICYDNQEELKDSLFRHMPRRRGGENRTEILGAPILEPRLGLQIQLTAALNTDLDAVNGELVEVQGRLFSAEAKIAELEARLGETVATPPIPTLIRVRNPALSPPRKKIRYNSSRSKTHILEE